jgi:hypothetical protein
MTQQTVVQRLASLMWVAAPGLVLCVFLGISFASDCWRELKSERPLVPAMLEGLPCDKPELSLTLSHQEGGQTTVMIDTKSNTIPSNSRRPIRYGSYLIRPQDPLRWADVLSCELVEIVVDPRQ